MPVRDPALVPGEQEPDCVNTKKKTTSYSWTIVVIVASLSTYYGHQSSQNEDAHSRIVTMAEQANKHFPITADALTRVDSIIAGPGNSFFYHVTLLTDDAAKLSFDELAQLDKHVRNGYCTTPQLAQFRKDHTKISWIYYDLSGTFVKNITIDPDSCHN